MGAGVDRSGPGIRVLLCLKPGIERPDVSNFGPPIVCDDCYAAWLAKRQA